MPEDHGPKLLITGASGFLGHALGRLASGRWSLFAQFRNNPVQFPGSISVQADLTDDHQLASVLDSIKPQALIHAAAESRVAYCQSHPEPSRVINRRVPERLAKYCYAHGIEFVFISTDLVFGGMQAPYHEQSSVRPLCEYARQKVGAENAVLRNHPGALVARLPLMVGLAPIAGRNFSMQMLSAIAAGRPLDLYVNEFRTPVDTLSAARGILTVLGKHSGLLHFGGRTRISRYALGVLMAKHMNVNPTMINPIDTVQGAPGAPRSPDCSLISDTAYALGYDPLPLDDAVGKVVDQFLTLHS
jgi:dTDP-4-dehydrorhamnose reductase